MNDAMFYFGAGLMFAMLPMAYFAIVGDRKGANFMAYLTFVGLLILVVGIII